MSSEIHSLDLGYLLRSKLDAFTDREADKDAEDILFLIDRYRPEVTGIKEQLNPEKIHKFVESLSSNQQSEVMRVFGI